MTFRYSGSKKRIIKHLPKPLFGTQCIIEPFAGSLAYSMHYRPREIYAAEANPLVHGLWEWLRTEATPERLLRLERIKPTERVDAYEWGHEHGLTEPEVTLVRLHISGAIVGQLSSKILYGDQHSLDLSGLRLHLHYIKRSLVPLARDFRDPGIVEASASKGAIAFIDPPYEGSSANYKSSGKDHGYVPPSDIAALVRSMQCPTIITYGDGAQDLFPEFEWETAVVRKVPILRGGGTRQRTEHFARINWPSYVEP